MRARHIGWTHRIPLALASPLFAAGLLTASGGTASAASVHAASVPAANGLTITIALGNNDLLILPPDPCRACTILIPGVLAIQPEHANLGS